MKTLMLAAATAAVVSAGAATDVKVEFWRDDVVRILKIPGGGKAPEKSYVVTAKPEKVSVAKSEKDGAATYSSAKLSVTVDAEGRVAFAAADGTPLLAEEGTTFTPRAKGDPDENSFSVRQAWLLDGDEPVYGGSAGQHRGLLSRVPVHQGMGSLHRQRVHRGIQGA